MAEGKVTVDVNVNDSDANKKIKELGSNLKGVGSPASDATKKVSGLAGSIKNIAIGSALGGGLTKALSMVSSGIGGLMHDLGASSATWKTFEGNLKNTGKSAGEIKKVKGELQDYATQTIYSASDMASTYAQLNAVGTKSTTELVKGFGGLASASESPTQAMKTLSQQATQMAAKPKVAWEDFKLIMEQSPAGIAAVAKTMGMSTQELIKGVQDGKIKTEDLFGAIEKTGNSKAFSKMATEFKTPQQAMDGLKETLTTKLQPTFDKVSGIAIKGISSVADRISKLDIEGFASKVGGVFEKVLKVIKGVVDYVQKNSDWIMPLVVGIGAFATVLKVVSKVKQLTSAIKAFQAGTKIATAVQGAFNAVMAINPFVLIIAAIAALVAGLVYFFTKTKTGKKIWKDFVSTMKKLWKGLSKFFTETWDSIVKTFNDAAKGVKNGWDSVTTFFSDLWNAIADGAKSSWDGVVDYLSGVWNGIDDAVHNIFDGIKNFFSDLWNGIVDTAKNVWSTFGESITEIWNGIVDIAKGIWGLIKDAIMGPILLVIDALTGDWKQFREDIDLIWSDIVQSAKDIWNGLVTFFSGIWDFISTYAQTAWDNISNFFGSIWNGIVDGAKNIWNGLSSFFSGLWNGIKSTAQGAWNGIVSFLTGLWNGTVNAAKNIWNALPGFFSGLWSRVTSFFSSAWNNIKSIVISAARNIVNGVRNVWNGFTNIVSNVVNGIKDGFNALRNFNLLDAGKAIMDSFLKGLKKAWKKVKDFIGGIASWIREHKGPISYDKKLLIPAGKAIMQGLDKGLMRNFENVKRTVGDMAGDIQKSFNGELSTGVSLSSGLTGLTAESALGLKGRLGATSSVINNYNNAVTNNERNGLPSVIETTVEIDGEKIVKKTAPLMSKVINQVQRDNDRLGGTLPL